MKLKDKIKNLRKDLIIMNEMEIKPNCTAFAGKYGLEQRTIKNYSEGYEGKSNIMFVIE